MTLPTSSAMTGGVGGWGQFDFGRCGDRLCNVILCLENDLNFLHLFTYLSSIALLFFIRHLKLPALK